MYLEKVNHVLLILFSVTFLFCTVNKKVIKKGDVINRKLTKTSTVDPCPEETDLNKTIIQNFLTASDWQKGRNETNTNHLSASQITLLKSPDYDSTCKTFNKQFHKAFAKKWPNGHTMNAVTYYKVGDFFFVIISPKQPKESDEFITGVSYIYIFDSDLNFIKGYNF